MDDTNVKISTPNAMPAANTVSTSTLRILSSALVRIKFPTAPHKIIMETIRGALIPFFIVVVFWKGTKMQTRVKAEIPGSWATGDLHLVWLVEE
jgi:hypothetical protein